MVNKRLITNRLPSGVCLLCEAPVSHGLICDACRQDLPRLVGCCRHCARPLPADATCPACQQRLPPYHAHAVYRYEYPLPLLIQRMKYRGNPGLAAELGELMLARPPAIGTQACLLPMPLHWRRQLLRGFNQALELARPVARQLELPLRPAICRRIRATRPQTDLQGRQRRHNVSGAFEVPPRQSLPAQVIVIDDVLTSGQTAAALARCLREAGVADVTVWTLARANKRL